MQSEQITSLSNSIVSMLENMNVPENWINPVLVSLNVILIAIIVVALDRLAKTVFLVLLSKLVQKSKNQWDDVFLENKVFHNLAHLVPVISLDYLVHMFFSGNTSLINVVDKISDIAIIWVFVMILYSVISSLTQLSKGDNKYVSIAIKSMSQLVKIFIFIFAFIASISVLLNIDLTAIFGTMGALMAVIILVFRDTILGFVASIQISLSKMVKIGDWVVLPEYGADGSLLELNLVTSKVQNWDNTVTNVPTYALISSGVKNWEKVFETGGRRIKRYINIDVNSVRFLSEDDISKFKKYRLLRDFIEKKEEEINSFNKQLEENSDIKSSRRRQTNIGLFRKYCELYLENNDNISRSHVLMVRQLQANEYGIPLEVYCFAADTRWVYYEAIQSDIFDHFYAIAGEFGLRIFQNPSGVDILSLKSDFKNG